MALQRVGEDLLAVRAASRASSMRSNPARAQVAASHSNTNVLMAGECL